MKNLKLAKITLVTMSLFLNGCAILHHVQLGQVDNRSGKVYVPFQVLISEVGVSAEEISKMAASSRSDAGDGVAGVAAIVSLFQMGPRTGKPTYAPKYAERLVYEIREKCPSGRVTGLMSVREMRDYPAVSGEIVKVTGYCVKDRKPANEAKVESAPENADEEIF